MPLVIQTNNAAITAQKNINTNNMHMNQALNRLSSGFRVNSAADDAAGFAIASKMDAQSARLKAASLNASQAQAMVKMADAGVNEIQNMLVRIQSLATQAASANNAGERAKLDAERIKLETQIDKIANSTNYNGINLLNGLDASSPAKAAVTASNGTGNYTAGTSTSITAVTMTANPNYVNDTYTFDMGTNGLTVTIKDSAGATQATATLTKGQANVVTLNNGTKLSITVANTADTTHTGAGTGGTFTVTGATAAHAAVAAGQSPYAAALSFQVGADNTADNQVTVDLRNSYTTTSLYAAYTGTATTDLLTQTNAQNYIDKAKAALDKLVTQRADLGATQNQLSYVQANLATSIEQTTASVSNIRDADIAAEMANFTKSQILVQAGTAMLAQANQVQQNVLRLFR